MRQDQVSGGVSVLCWLAAPVAMFYGNLQNSVIRSKSVLKSSSVISSQIGVMSDKLRVSLKCTTLSLKCDYWADSLIDGQTDARHTPDKVILKRRRMKLCHPRKTRFFYWTNIIFLPTTGRYINGLLLLDRM